MEPQYIVGIITAGFAVIFFLVEVITTKSKDLISITRDIKSLIDKKEKLENEEIKIFLENEETGETILLPYFTRRKNLNRGELSGIFGMFSGGRRYDLPNISKLFYSGNFDSMLQGDSSMLTVVANEVEFFKFKNFIANINHALV